jgi:hypothetical protein
VLTVTDLRLGESGSAWLQCVLRFWSGMVIATNRLGFYEAQEAALTVAGGGCSWRIEVFSATFS